MAQDRLTVIVNRRGGTAGKLGDKLADSVHEAFAQTGRAIDLMLIEPDEIDAVIHESKSDTIAVGGGDGTLGTAAGALAGTDRRLAVLPLGTLNHFAAAIGLSGDLQEAAQVAVHGTPRRVDLGRAGQRVFLNNASLGIYARMVKDRDARSLPKWLATVPAALRVLRRPGARRVRLTIDGSDRIVKTPLLFIGNNRYSLERDAIGQRASLTEGRLSLYAIAGRGSAGLLATAVRILDGRVNLAADFAALTEAHEVTAYGLGYHHLALDGEVVELPFPLTFSSAPGALTVMAPG